jgi:hypothetical protein
LLLLLLLLLLPLLWLPLQMTRAISAALKSSAAQPAVKEVDVAALKPNIGVTSP